MEEFLTSDKKAYAYAFDMSQEAPLPLPLPPHPHEDGAHHFLDSCYLCHQPLAGGDIFMYRGDTPFCSEECRQEQMDMDDAEDKRIRRLIKQQRKTQSQTQTQTSTTSANIQTRVTGTVVAT